MQIAPPGSEQRFGRTVPDEPRGHVDEMAGAAVFRRVRHVQLHHRADDPQSTAALRPAKRLVSPSGDRRVRARPELVAIASAAQARAQRVDTICPRAL